MLGIVIAIIIVQRGKIILDHSMIFARGQASSFLLILLDCITNQTVLQRLLLVASILLGVDASWACACW